MCTLQHLQLGREIRFSSGKVQKKYVNIRCRKDLQDFLQLILSI